MMVQMGVFNTLIINELLVLYPEVHLVIAVCLNFIGLFRRLYGGTGGFYMHIAYISICTIIFCVTMKLLRNLDKNLVMKISKKQV
jgi:hypothetical protein